MAVTQRGPLGEDQLPPWEVWARCVDDGELVLAANGRVSLERGLRDAHIAIETHVRESVA